MTTHSTEVLRAVEIGAIALARHVNDIDPDDAAFDLAAVVISALITRPEVLHDLTASTPLRLPFDGLVFAEFDHPHDHLDDRTDCDGQDDQ